MSIGWIKLHRSILEWEWYDDHNTTRLFFHLLLKANHSDAKYKGVIIKRGTLVTGQDVLASQVGISRMILRTCLERLKLTNEITIKTSGKGSIIQIVNYNNYQSITSDLTTDKPTDNQQITNDQPAINQRLTTNNKNKKEEEEEEEFKEEKRIEKKVYAKDVHTCLYNCLKFFPKHLHPSKDVINVWLDTIEKLNRIEKLPFDIIEGIVKKTRNDDFWSKNFLSIPKLRKKDKNGVMYILVFNESIKKEDYDKFSEESVKQRLADGVEYFSKRFNQ